MKNISKTILFATIAMIAIGMASCKDDTNNGNGGAPFISYVRITNPASSDSLLVAAGQGQQIAIVGGNLQNTKQMWFNDQKATLIPPYITNTTIIVTVPTPIPQVVTNILKLIFANGDSLLYNFTVSINPPVIDHMDCEYVSEGATATIHGQYFYYPLTVTFPGGKSVTSGDAGSAGVSVDASNTILTVKIPAGATTPGQITVQSNFGTTKSNFWFLDTRNILEGFEGDFGGMGNIGQNPASAIIVSNPGAGDPSLINGNYCRIIKPGMGSWDWTEVYARWSAPYCTVPDDAMLHPSLYNFKFELCTMKPYNANSVRLWVTNPSVANNTPDGVWYNWNPPYDTKGSWQTIIIPFEDVASALGNYFPGSLLAGGYFSAFVFCGNGSLNCDMAFDNFRVVPKTLIN